MSLTMTNMSKVIRINRKTKKATLLKSHLEKTESPNAVIINDMGDTGFPECKIVTYSKEDYSHNFRVTLIFGDDSAVVNTIALRDLVICSPYVNAAIHPYRNYSPTQYIIEFYVNSMIDFYDDLGIKVVDFKIENMTDKECEV